MPKRKIQGKSSGNTVLTRKRYEKSGATPLKWMPNISEVEKPLSKEDSLRYIKVTGGKIPAKKSKIQYFGDGSPATRNRYQLAGEKPLCWLKNIKETNKPLSKIGSIRYAAETEDFNETSTDIKQESKSVTFSDETIEREMDIGTKRKSPRLNNVTNKKIKLDARITRNVANDLRKGTTTRNRYKLSAGPSLTWLKDIKESDNPLTKQGSTRLKMEQVRASKITRGKPIKRAKGAQKVNKVSEAKQGNTIINEIKNSESECDTNIGSRVTRNKRIMAGEKPLLWMKNINEIDRPLSRADSSRYIKETMKLKSLPSLRKIQKRPKYVAKINNARNARKTKKIIANNKKDSHITPEKTRSDNDNSIDNTNEYDGIEEESKKTMEIETDEQEMLEPEDQSIPEEKQESSLSLSRCDTASLNNSIFKNDNDTTLEVSNTEYSTKANNARNARKTKKSIIKNRDKMESHITSEQSGSGNDNSIDNTDDYDGIAEKSKKRTMEIEMDGQEILEPEDQHIPEEKQESPLTLSRCDTTSLNNSISKNDNDTTIEVSSIKDTVYVTKMSSATSIKSISANLSRSQCDNQSINRPEESGTSMTEELNSSTEESYLLKRASTKEMKIDENESNENVTKSLSLRSTLGVSDAPEPISNSTPNNSVIESKSKMFNTLDKNSLVTTYSLDLDQGLLSTNNLNLFESDLGTHSSDITNL